MNTKQDAEHRWRALTDSLKGIEIADPNGALEGSRLARKFATANGLVSEAVESQLTMAYNMARLGDTTALAELDSAIGQRMEQGDTLLLLRALRIQGDAQQYLFRLDAASETLTKAIAIAEQYGAHVEQAQLFLSLGEVWSRQGNNAEALRIMERGVTASLASGDQDVIAMAYVILASTEVRTGRVDEAAMHFDSCITRAQKYDLPHRGAVAHANLGYLRSLQGDYPRAADNFQRAADVQEKLGNKDATSVAYYGLASVLESMGERVEAYETYERSLAMERAMGNAQREALFKGGSGILLAGMDTAQLRAVGRDPDRQQSEALQMMNGGLAASKAMQYSEMTAGLEVAIGRSLLQMGRTEEARTHLQAGADLYQRISDPLGSARAQWNLGVLADSMDQKTRALQHYDHAIALADSAANKEVAALALDSRHALHRRTGRLRSALADKVRAAQLWVELHNESNTAQVTRTRLRSQFAREQEADSLAHVQALADQERHAAADLAVQQQRTLLSVGIGSVVIVAGALVYLMDRRRRQERFQRKALQLEMQTLRAQMNPHFLFNALASINGFIGRQDTAAAKAFVARFAKLTRMVLENSRHTEVTLAKDLEALRLYMELEQLRSVDKFDFHIALDPSVDPEDVHVPPLVLQPLVENAIWHGIADKAGRGVITVRVSKDNDTLLLSVEDDGVGRNKVSGNAPDKSTSRPSLGTTITCSRLDLLAQQKGRPAELRFADRMVGTKVELTLPL